MARIFDAFKQFFDGNGDPLASGVLTFYEDGVYSNLQDTFSDASLNNPNPNPVTLNGEGRLPFDVFGEGSYSVELRTKATTASPNGVLIGLLDTVGGATGSRLAFSDWVSNILYGIPAIVVGSDGLYYESQQLNNLDNDPVLNPGTNEFWEEIRFIGVWNTNITYDIGVVVQTTDGNLWRSLTATAGNDPSTDDGTNWAFAVNVGSTNQPTNISPLDGSLNVPVTATLTGSAYSGTDTLVQVIVRIYDDAGGTSLIYSDNGNIVDTGSTIIINIPESAGLQETTEYWWSLQYVGLSSISTASVLTSFTASIPLSEVFAVTGWLGTGAALDVISGLDFTLRAGWAWGKNRDGAFNHTLANTLRGANKWLISQNNSVETASANVFTAFNDDGFSVGSSAQLNNIGDNNIAVQFLVEPGLFDIVEWTGDGIPGKAIAIGLDDGGSSESGINIIKSLDGAYSWAVQHRSLGGTQYLVLDTTAALATSSTFWNDTSATSTTLTLGSNVAVNEAGKSYISFNLAHNPSRGRVASSYVGTGAAGNKQTLGFKVNAIPILKSTNTTGDWDMFDDVRNPTNPVNKVLRANLSSAEVTLGAGSGINFLSDGFDFEGAENNVLGVTYIYYAVSTEL